LRQKKKVDAEIVPLNQHIGSGYGHNFNIVDAGVREVHYKKRRKSMDALDMRKYVTKSDVREQRQAMLAKSRETTKQQMALI
jgi:hypothetical protein